MTILIETLDSSSDRPAHHPWCATPRGADGGACYSDVINTAVGGMWLSQHDRGVVVVTDTRAGFSLDQAEALDFMAALASLIADAAPADGGDVPVPVAIDVADAVASLSDRAALQLVAAITARLAGAR